MFYYQLKVKLEKITLQPFWNNILLFAVNDHFRVHFTHCQESQNIMDNKKDQPKYRWHAFYVCKSEAFLCCNYQSINDELNKHKKCPKCHMINYPEDQVSKWNKELKNMIYQNEKWHTFLKKMQPKYRWHAFYVCEKEMLGRDRNLLCYKYQFINDDPNESKLCPKWADAICSRKICK